MSASFPVSHEPFLPDTIVDQVRTKCCRCHSDDPSEDLGEITLIGKTRNCGNLNDANLWIPQMLFRALDLPTQNILVRAKPCTTLEEVAEVMRPHGRHSRQSR